MVPATGCPGVWVVVPSLSLNASLCILPPASYLMRKGPVSNELSKAMSAPYCSVGRMDPAMDMGSWERPMKEGGTGTVEPIDGMVAVHTSAPGADGAIGGGDDG